MIAQLHVLTSLSAVAGPFDEGQQAARNSLGTISEALNATSARAVIPGYTDTPPEASYAGRTNLRSEGAARLSGCATNPADPTCAGVTSASTSASLQRQSVSPFDPAVLGADAISLDPAAQLGGLSAFYSGCSVGSQDVTERIETKTCTRSASGANFSCSQSLSVDVKKTPNCPIGEWYAGTSIGGIHLDVQCLPDRPVTNQHFRITESGTPLAFFDVDMAGTGGLPQKVASLGTRYVWDVGNVERAAFATDRSCTDETCSLRVLITDTQRRICNDGSDNGLTDCRTVAPFEPVYSSCPVGTTAGSALYAGICSEDSNSTCRPNTLNPSVCYQPSSGGTYAYRSPTGGPASRWATASTRTIAGWSANPEFGAIPDVRLTYTRPLNQEEIAEQWVDQCPALAEGGRCVIAGERRCVEGPATKTINGTEVTRECWRYDTPIACEGAADGCEVLAQNPECTATGTTCQVTNPETGVCEQAQQTYMCTTPAQSASTVTNCPADVFCLNGNCFNLRAANDEDFARVMSFLEAGREAGVYLDTDRMEVFKGEANRCRDRLLKNCCTSNAAGKSMTNQSVLGTGTKLVFDVLMNSGNRQFVTAAINAMISGTALGAQTFTTYGFTVAVNGAALPAGTITLYSSAAGAGSAPALAIGVDPWSLALTVFIYVAMTMLECSTEEARVAMQEGANLCVSLGTYCSSCIRVLGRCVTCIERTTGKCCFNSVLARIVNEQGRQQIGKGWGNARNPDCSGFTVAQLQVLDFAAMDLSEFYASIVPTEPDLAAIQARAAARVGNCYWGDGRC